MDNDTVWSGVSMTAGDAARAIATVILTLAAIVLGPAAVAAASPPNLAIEQPLAGSATNDQLPAFVGTSEDELHLVTVRVYAGTSVSEETLLSTLVTLLPPFAGVWSVTEAAPLEPGQYTAVAEQETEGEPATSEAVTFTVDTTAPAVSIDPISSPIANPAPSLSGGAGNAAGDNDTVSVTIHRGASTGGEVVAEGVVPVEGTSWSYTPSALPDGTYTAQATQQDEAGNTGTSLSSTFTVDTKAPQLSIKPVTSPTDDATPALGGELGAEAGDSPTVAVKVYKGSAASGEVAASGKATVEGATWTYTSTHLPDGTYTAQATQLDEAGNIGKSTATTFTVDTVAPSVTITVPVEGAVLNASKTTLSGLAGQLAGDDPSVELKLYAGASVSGSPAQTLEVTASAGKWTTGASGPILANGIYTLLAEQADAAGNVGRRTATFTIKTSSPVVTLDSSGFPRRGSTLVADATPSFTGSASTAPEDSEVVLVKIFGGSSTSGSPLTTVAGTLSGSKWHAGPVEALPDGTYTALAEQADSNPFSQTGVSTSVTFTVDGHAPAVTLTSPAGGSSTSSSEPLGGAAGTAAGDLATVTIPVYAGTGAAGSPIESISVEATGATWSTTLGGLSPGTYTVRAEQRDDVGNVGRSAPATFTVTSAAPSPPPTPPVASFQWFPSTPRVGEPVSLVSTSTDASSALTAFAWSVTGGAAFEAVGPTITTTFSTAGPHAVRLLVTDANGQSDVVTETITAVSPAPALMQPFPVVRIAGSASSSGAKISLLAVQAPIGASVSIACHGHGCPAKSRDTVSASGRTKSKAGLVLITFRRFERALQAGAYLQIRIYAPGQIGKYTRFTIRHGKLPSRVDTCLSPDGVKPMACPS
jgi:hypothetical protein